MPVTAYELYALDVVLESLELYARSAPTTARYRDLVERLWARLGVAQIFDVRAKEGPTGLEWAKPPEVMRREIAGRSEVLVPPTGEQRIVVPVTFDELEVILAGLRAERATPMTVRTRGYAHRKAGALLRRFGGCHALGYSEMPVSSCDVRGLDAVLESLQMYRRAADVTARFRELVEELSAALAVAQICELTAAEGAAGLQWVRPPEVMRDAWPRGRAGAAA
jgi:hypothetical protein